MDTEIEESACVICADCPPSVRFSPCGHVVACAPCVNRLRIYHAPGRPPCPCCRAPIATLTPLHLEPRAASRRGADAPASAGASLAAWPGRVLLLIEGRTCIDLALKRIAFPPPGPGVFGALRAAVGEACFSGEAPAPSSLVLRFLDLASESEIFVDVEDDDAVGLMVDIWCQGAAFSRPVGRGDGGETSSAPMPPVLHVGRRDGARAVGTAFAPSGGAGGGRHGGGHLAVGSLVVLARGWDRVGDAASGCLAPGNYGRVIDVRRNVNLGGGWNNVTGYRVQLGEVAAGHFSYWYAREAICPLGSPFAALPREHDFEVGTPVALARGYGAVTDAALGNLRPGDIGTIIVSDGTATPYFVESADGEKWWFERGALCLPLSANVAMAAEAWLGGDQPGGAGAGTPAPAEVLELSRRFSRI